MKQYKDTPYYITNDGKIFRDGKELKSRKDKDGYLIIKLSVNGKRLDKRVSRLVAETYIPNPNNLPQVNHIDGNKEHNCYINLEWITPKGNTQHAIENNLRNTIGEMNGQSKLKENDVISIRELYRTGDYSYGKLSLKFGISDTHIKRIINYNNWKHI